MLSPADLDLFHSDGYLVVRGLFTLEETTFYRDHFMRVRASGTYPGDDLGVARSIDPNGDPLRNYPRMIHMHHWDETALNWLLTERIRTCLNDLLGRDPYAVQTMLYFKPPGSRGQALHQDNYYLRAQPGTCIAAWMALDPCEEANGCMQVVPGSHKWPLLCTIKADTEKSFTDVTVPIPEETPIEPVIMAAGDVLFFNGSVVHGSFANTTPDRFRRALIGHYIEGDCQQVAEWYSPILRMNGTPVQLENSELGGKCGTWVEADGAPMIIVNNYDKTLDATAL